MTAKGDRKRTAAQIKASNDKQYAKAKNDPIKYANRLKQAAAFKRKVREPIKAARILSEQEKAAQAMQAELASRVLSRRRLLPFIQRLDDKYDAGWVHHDICKRLEKFSRDVADGLSPRLMLLMPPRAGKSRIASQSFPAWHLGQYPHHEFIACSYNISLALTFSRKVQTLIDSPDYRQVFPETTLDANNRSAESWGITGETGGYVAAGVGGGITGKGAHILVIDDPVKNAEEADSATTRDAIMEWFGSTAYTRLAPGGGVLLIMTSWHDSDLAGQLQATMQADPEADQYETIRYQAVAENDEYLDPTTNEIVRLEPASVLPTEGLTPLRKKGDALHPARYDITKLNRIKKTLSPRFWSALYQQNPVPDDGTYFTREQFRRSGLPQARHCHVFITWDFAISEKTTNDYTVGVVGLQDYDDVVHIADVIRFKSGDGLFIVNAIIAAAKRWAQPNMRMGFEDGQIFRAIETLLKRRMKEEKVYFPYEKLKPLTDKLVRARPLQGRMQQGMVSYSDKGEWFSTVQQEMLRFPAGVHDDTVDAQAWLAHMVLNQAAPAKPVDKAHKSWRDKIRTHERTANNGSHMTA